MGATLSEHVVPKYGECEMPQRATCSTCLSKQIATLTAQTKCSGVEGEEECALDVGDKLTAFTRQLSGGASGSHAGRSKGSKSACVEEHQEHASENVVMQVSRSSSPTRVPDSPPSGEHCSKSRRARQRQKKNEMKRRVPFSVSTMEPQTSSSLQISIENPGKLRTWYIIERRPLGAGSFGSVRKAQVRATGALRAVKSISRKQRTDLLQQEISLLKIVDHPNIIKLHEIFESSTHIQLVMEFCPGGNLKSRIRTGGILDEPAAAIVMQQVLRAVYYLHKSHICHRDIKSDNMLFTNTETCLEATTLKVTDFGLSCKIKPGDYMSSKVGTPTHMSPQVFAKRYNQTCDLWSCGVVLYTILCGTLPFTGETNEIIQTRVERGTFTFGAVDLTQAAVDFIHAHLRKSSSERITAEKALSDPWLRDRVPKTAAVPLPPDLLVRMGEFRSLNRFKRAALHVIVSLLSETQMRGQRETFMSLDTDGDGILSQAEVRERLQRTLGKEAASAPDVDDAFHDEDKAVNWTYTEFLAATFNRTKYIQEDVCKAAFSSFDKDGDGQISKEELRQGRLLGDLCTEELATLVEELDLNRNGTIDFEEFRDMMRATAVDRRPRSRGA
mmetsp:Transcript_27874/g.59008  ORF Transcript_27874/g.59008 Transcript_27874/m.59008 type:complete len:614 (-) Transcript_27874:178-2019(-)